MLAYRYRNKHYTNNHPWRRYFIPALSVKIFGAIFIGLIYQYYYGGGDTFEFFRHSLIINSSLDESFIKWVNLLFRIPGSDNGNYYEYISQMRWYNDPTSYTVAAITSVINVFTFNTYLPTSVLFAFISFSGVWALFRAFATNYPKLIKPIATATLFIPSTFVWGSGIFKDTICLFGLGWLTYCTFRFLIQKDFSVKNILLTVVSFLLIVNVKLYILLGFIPALLLWMLFLYSERVKTKGVKILLRLGFSFFSVGFFFIFMQNFGDQLGKYSLDDIAETAQTTRNWIGYVSEIQDGAGYDLGDFDPSIQGMLGKFPAAINVTLFRPYLWESKKAIVLLSSLEALVFLFLTLKLLFTVPLGRIWKAITGDPTIQFCLIFSLIFAFSVGISSYNFGALSRYKIPCLPFYILFIILTYYSSEKNGKRLIKGLNL